MLGEHVTNLEDKTAAETLSPLAELPGPSNTSENTPYSNKKKKSKKKKEAEKSSSKKTTKKMTTTMKNGSVWIL